MHEVVADAPGRVNLIGEHTDYQEGFVLPVALPQRTTATVRPRNDHHVTAVSADVSPPIDYELGREQRGLGWGDYIQGVTYILARDGHRLSGFDVQLRSEVPPGSGLSSSAALEVSLLRALRQAFDLTLDDVQLARLAQRAEVEFVGARVGIMDQMASSLGTSTDALFLDTRTLLYEYVSLPHPLAIIVIDSGVTHQHVGGEYLVRRAEAEEAARLLGVRCLRDVTVRQLGRLQGLPSVLRRRARHIVSENDRVLKACDALRCGELENFGRLLLASHESMRDDYEISTAEIDLLVELSVQRAGVFGARLTGGGFGGCVVIAAEAGFAADIAADVCREYEHRSGRRGTIRLPMH